MREFIPAHLVLFSKVKSFDDNSSLANHPLLTQLQRAHATLFTYTVLNWVHYFSKNKQQLILFCFSKYCAYLNSIVL